MFPVVKTCTAAPVSGSISALALGKMVAVEFVNNVYVEDHLPVVQSNSPAVPAVSFSSSLDSLTHERA